METGFVLWWVQVHPREIKWTCSRLPSFRWTLHWRLWQTDWQIPWRMGYGVGWHKQQQKTHLVIINGNLNAQCYRDEIQAPVVIPYVNANPNAIFQQDNARPHTARLTTQYLQANNVDVMEWPSKSPDLSPIEQVWDLLDRRVRQRPVQPQTLRQLQHALVQEWNNIPMNVIRRYIRSMRRRGRRVIQSAGGHTRYWNVVTFEKQPQWRVCDHCGVIWWVNPKPLKLFTARLFVFICVKFHEIIIKNEWAIWIWSLRCVSSLG